LIVINVVLSQMKNMCSVKSLWSMKNIVVYKRNLWSMKGHVGICAWLIGRKVRVFEEV